MSSLEPDGESDYPTEDVPDDPAELLAEWLPPNDEPDRPLMTLSTIDADGWPTSRTVLLSSWTPDGFCLHTDSRTTKIAELDATGRAALVLHLPLQARQLVAQGTVEPTPPLADEVAYANRSAYLRVLAWLNTDDFATQPLAVRRARWAAMMADEPELTAPPTWTGRRIRPTRLVFWTGRPDTASRRIEYAATDGTWAKVAVRAG